MSACLLLSPSMAPYLTHSAKIPLDIQQPHLLLSIDFTSQRDHPRSLISTTGVATLVGSNPSIHCSIPMGT
ncbi:hypothetical protein JAAARDRAFT_30435 [Jaapia argillacea MUCL 33604]|uniref:Uncharacterized protein n=1 Tax=Jaapia argillacea MUCL 33604 TaxID=933084 RepID=A0A067QGA0_9AGAM|nr:hypothetical protein JAAARDRAFT_30435 [Jaapia argillacea MUCL 33604]